MGKKIKNAYPSQTKSKYSVLIYGSVFKRNWATKGKEREKKKSQINKTDRSVHYNVEKIPFNYHTNG